MFTKAAPTADSLLLFAYWLSVFVIAGCYPEEMRSMIVPVSNLIGFIAIGCAYRFLRRIPSPRPVAFMRLLPMIGLAWFWVWAGLPFASFNEAPEMHWASIGLFAVLALSGTWPLYPEENAQEQDESQAEASCSWLQAVFGCLAVAGWFSFLIFFHHDWYALRNGSPIPTPTMPELYASRGRTVYISHEMTLWIQIFQWLWITGIVAFVFLLIWPERSDDSSA